MGSKTKIDWADSTWNPVTGCLHGCEYCYARRIAERFSCEGQTLDAPAELQRVWLQDSGADLRKNGCHVLRYPVRLKDNGRICPYPFGFAPTFHRYKLDEPQQWKKPRTIFVCSMADLFGEWVPDEWIIEVLNACREAPQHRYLFLTKNPERYDRLEDAGIITDQDQNFWLGSTVTDECRDKLHYNFALHTFQSCEPMLAPWPPAQEPNQRYKGAWPEWVIFGAETGNRKGKVIPEKAWIDNAVQMCRNVGAKVFMKESLREIMGDDFRQEYPWEV